MQSQATQSKKTLRHLSPKALGILYILSAAFFFSMMTFFVKLSGDVPAMQKVFFRNLIALVVAFFTLARSEQKFHVRKDSWLGLFIRCLAGTLGMIANFWAIDRLGLADSNILNKMSPFFAIVMSMFILKEKPNKIEWGSVVLALIGAAFVIKPSAGIASLPALIGLAGGFGAGTAYTFVRKLSKQGERGPVIVFAFSLFSVLFTAPYLLFHYHPMEWKQLLFLLIAGVGGAGGQFSITAAYAHAPAREISVFDYAQVLFAALWGFFAFGEVPDALSIVGYVIIIGVAVFRWWYNLKAEPAHADEAASADPASLPTPSETVALATPDEAASADPASLSTPSEAAALAVPAKAAPTATVPQPATASSTSALAAAALDSPTEADAQPATASSASALAAAALDAPAEADAQPAAPVESPLADAQFVAQTTTVPLASDPGTSEAVPSEDGESPQQ